MREIDIGIGIVKMAIITSTTNSCAPMIIRVGSDTIVTARMI
jgi:hypothetical protein